MTDKQPKPSTAKPVTPTSAAAKNGQPAKKANPAPAVTARRPLSKAEYARTTAQAADSTSVIPAVREDTAPPTEQKPPTPTKAPVKKAAAAKKAPAPQAPAKKAAAPSAAGVKPVDVQAKAAETTAPIAKTTAPVATPAPRPSVPVQSAQPTQTAPAAPAAQAVPVSQATKLRVRHIEPWSVTKLAFVVSVALMIVSVVAVTVFWVVLQMTGIWGAINDTISGVLSDNSSSFDITEQIGFGRVVGLTLLVSSLNVIFMTALATISAHLYNLAAGLIGGVELTLNNRK